MVELGFEAFTFKKLWQTKFDPLKVLFIAYFEGIKQMLLLYRIGWYGGGWI